jgi:UDP-N-acetylmuramate dehydrogenase
MSLYETLLGKIKGKILLGEPMRKHTSLLIGGPVDVMIIPKDVEDITYATKYAEEKGLPIYVIGNGSKLLVADHGIHGIIIKIANTLDELAVIEESIIAGAGCFLSKLIRIAIKYNLSGIEFAAGIPGTLGGAITMNAGTYLGSMNDVVEEVTAMDIPSCSIRVLSNEECHFGFRKSLFQETKFIILQAKLRLRKGNPDEIKKRIDELVQKRKRTQPLNVPNAGCIFMNPPGISAGELIDRLGLKGFQVGGAQISKVHANFIVNSGSATASDVLRLIQTTLERVQNIFGIKLEPEIRILGMTLEHT